MTKHTADPGMAQAYVELRRARIADVLGRALEPVGADAPPLPPERIRFLRREAIDLYSNELAWEQLTAEEEVSGGHLTELVFPGFLAFVDGLLLEGDAGGLPNPPRPHPDVVEAILTFLAERYTALTAEIGRGADSQRLVWARAMTARLVDLVLYRLYQLTPDEKDTLDALA